MTGPEAVLAAARAIDGHVVRTPLVHAPELSRLAGCELHLKLENLQITGAFKARGALVKLLSLSEAERKAGVIAMSAGNHAQGVALHAKRLGIPATVVMPKGTPFTKVERTETLGARVLLEGDTLDAAAARAQTLAAENGYIFIHPYDDPDVIAGQGTIGLEMLADRPDLDVLMVPVGGGGLISGIAVAARHIKPEIEIVGVQSEAFPAMARALGKSRAPLRAGGQTLAEGIAVKQPGKLTSDIAARLVDDMLLAEEIAIEKAVQRLLDIEKIVAEGAAAAALAALFANAQRFAGRKVGMVISGGNIDSRLLAQCLMRGLARDGRLARLRVEVPDSPGALSRMTRLVGEGEGNIVEIFHQRLFLDVPLKRTEVDVLVETVNAGHVERIVESLNGAGFPARILGTTSGTED